jgi:hypothetical protein
MTWIPTTETNTTIDVNNGQSTQSYTQTSDSEYDISVSGNELIVGHPISYRHNPLANGDYMDHRFGYAPGYSSEDVNPFGSSQNYDEFRLKHAFDDYTHDIYIKNVDEAGGTYTTELGKNNVSSHNFTTSWKPFDYFFIVELRNQSGSEQPGRGFAYIEMKIKNPSISVDGISKQ